MIIPIPDPNTQAGVRLGQPLWQKVDGVVRVPYAFAPGVCKYFLEKLFNFIFAFPCFSFFLFFDFCFFFIDFFLSTISLPLVNNINDNFELKKSDMQLLQLYNVL